MEAIWLNSKRHWNDTNVSGMLHYKTQPRIFEELTITLVPRGNVGRTERSNPASSDLDFIFRMPFPLPFRFVGSKPFPSSPMVMEYLLSSLLISMVNVLQWLCRREFCKASWMILNILSD